VVLRLIIRSLYQTRLNLQCLFSLLPTCHRLVFRAQCPLQDTEVHHRFLHRGPSRLQFQKGRPLWVTQLTPLMAWVWWPLEIKSPAQPALWSVIQFCSKGIYLNLTFLLLSNYHHLTITILPFIRIKEWLKILLQRLRSGWKKKKSVIGLVRSEDQDRGLDQGVVRDPHVEADLAVYLRHEGLSLVQAASETDVSGRL
jgi:hypothetical protein